jgi:uncharacterized membrane protein YgaE (UPF0421/DUF939 family)
MQARHFEAIIFSAKATIGTVMAALAYKFFGLPGAPWVAAVSAVLVTQLDLHSSWKASLLRVAANIAGALCGAIFLTITGKPIVAMAIGVMATSFVCHLLKQDDALRPAAVAVILVTIISGSSEWHNSFNRVAGVIIGCICALIVGFLFDKLTGIIKPPDKEQKEKTRASE